MLCFGFLWLPGRSPVSPFQSAYRASGRRHPGKIYIILLDNGRSRIADSRYSELFFCIGCRTCSRVCPAAKYFDIQENHFLTSPKECLFYFLFGRNMSIDLCLQCDRCQTECPLEIDLPAMILDARNKILKHRRSISEHVLAKSDLFFKARSGLSSHLVEGALNKDYFRWLGEKMIGISRKRPVPPVQKETFAKWFDSLDKTN